MTDKETEEERHERIKKASRHFWEHSREAKPILSTGDDASQHSKEAQRIARQNHPWFR
jgi:hypothetical protein